MLRLLTSQDASVDDFLTSLEVASRVLQVTGDGKRLWAAFEACASGAFTSSSLQLAEGRLLQGLLHYKLCNVVYYIG